MKKVGITAAIVVGIIAAYVLGYNIRFHYDSNYPKMKVLSDGQLTNIPFISENDYAASMAHIVVPFVDSIGKSGTWKHDGHVIAYNQYLLDSPKANIIISHGFSERKEKYKEAIYYFLKMGYQVYVLDHYGHGNSSRATSDSCLLHATDYHIYVNDLSAFITQVVRPTTKGVKTILFGHSMGGGIAARVVEMQPDLVDGLILSAPLMKLGTPGAPPEFLAAPIIQLMTVTGKGAAYAMGQRPYNPATDSAYNPANPGTLCRARGQYWRYYQQSLTQQPSSGSSWQLAGALLAMTHDVVQRKNVQHIKIPILLLQAEKDTYVAPEGQFTFANNAPNIDCYLVHGAGHEMYCENDRIIAPYYSKLRAFVEQVRVRGGK